MPQLIKPQNVSVVTKDGELLVNIVLELNINLNAGAIDVSATAKEVNATRIEMPKSEKTQWAIPDFGPSEKIEFGKKEIKS